MIPRICLVALLLVAPFEPRFTVPIGLFQISLVEAVALVAFVGLALDRGRRVAGRTIRSAPVVLALSVMVVFALISASLAEVDPGRALKFAMRLGAMTLFAVLVAGLGDREEDLKWGFRALAFAGTAAALLAVAEGLGFRSLDVFLGAFREIPFNVAGIRRATAGSEYPNLGAAMIAYALMAGVVLLRSRPWTRALWITALTTGLAFTYSRGAWLAGLVGLAVLAFFERGRLSVRVVPVAVYLTVLGLFVGREEISQIRLGGENANDFYAATYETAEAFTLESAERTVVPITVRNIGRRPWRANEEIHLSYHLYEHAGRPLVDGPRTDLPHDVLPGEIVTFEAVLRAPAQPGQYLLMWDLVHEDTTWFSGQGVKPGIARLSVSGGAEGAARVEPTEAAALGAIPDTLAWRPSRVELWTIASKMWAENPFFGVGPDNFRWTHGRFAGKPVFDTRVFANNTFLELAATLGAFGLAAFGVAIAFALVAGFRAAASSEAVLIAWSIVVVMMVHGLADYLLAFTGHYLVFGYAMGVLARPAAARVSR